MLNGSVDFNGPKLKQEPDDWRPEMAQPLAEPVLKDLKAVNRALKNLADMNARMQLYASKQKRLRKDIEEYLKFHKDAFSEPQQLTNGEIGFEDVKPYTKYMAGWTSQKIVAKLKELRQMQFISEGVNKQAIFDSDKTESELVAFGCKRVDDEEKPFIKLSPKTEAKAQKNLLAVAA